MLRGRPLLMALVLATPVALAAPVPHGGARAQAPTVVRLVQSSLDVGGRTLKRLAMEGEGPAWGPLGGGVDGLRFDASVGEQFEVQWVNELTEPALIHAHGQTPPQGLDGVPYVDAPPLEANRSVTYTYGLKQPDNVGSYFVHSHYGFQHEQGLSAPLVIEGPLPPLYPDGRRIAAAPSVVMFLEDVCAFQADNPDGNPNCDDSESVFKELKDDWESKAADFNFTECEASATDWDVGYRHHIANHRTLADPAVVLVDQDQSLLRLRLINGADMTNYKLDFGGLPATLIATDGQPVLPVRVPAGQGAGRGVWLGVSQRLDVVLSVPRAPGAYLVRAVAEGGELDARVWQSGLVVVVGGATHVPPPGTYSVKPEEPAGLYQSSNTEPFLRAWRPLSPVPDTALVGPDAGPLSARALRRFTLNLTGDNGFMSINRQSWQLPPQGDGVFKPNPYPLLVRNGERVCITFRNFNSDSHPMHLHGHSFEVVRMGGANFRGAMRDVVMVDAGLCNEVELCFNADNPGTWPLHCHLNYHLGAGMLTTVEYFD